MMIVILILLGFGIAIGVFMSAGRRAPPVEIASEPLAEDLTASELAAEDPVEALLRYGTPADVTRLGDQGVDLGGLGYRAPGDE